MRMVTRVAPDHADAIGYSGGWLGRTLREDAGRAADTGGAR